MRCWLVCLATWLLASAALDAAPKVEIVVGEKAPAGEQRAAEEIGATLTRLYDAEVAVVVKPGGKLPTIFVGSPTTNDGLDFFGTSWPRLTDRDYLVQSTTYREQPALVIGGLTPQAVYWAAAEYQHALGVRTLLYGDLDPIAPSEFSLAKFDLRGVPARDERAWQLGGNSPVGTISWSADDLQRLVRQLAKLKFTKIVVQVYADQPFVPLAEGITKFRLWDAPPLSVSGDTAGRSAFRGAALFENPDFVGKQTSAEQLAAGQAWLPRLIKAANEHGMSVAVQHESETVDQKPVSENVVAAQVAAYRRAYPQLDVIYTRSGQTYVPQLPTNGGGQAEPSLLLDPQLGLRQLAEKNEAGLSLDRKTAAVVLPLTGQPAGILPQTSPAAVAEVQQLLGRLRGGHVATSLSPADVDFVAYYLSRTASGDKLNVAQACDQLLTPICGEEVHTRVTQAMQLIDQAALAIDLNDPELAVPGPEIAWKHYEAAAESPAWWGKVRESYLNAMNEMYRANTRAREGSRSYTLHLARRYEFGLEYMNCLQALRAAGVAKKEKDKDKQIAELEKAIDSINNACNALAAVARNNSDRGTIAVLNAYIYHPLVKELERADAEE